MEWSWDVLQMCCSDSYSVAVFAFYNKKPPLYQKSAFVHHLYLFMCLFSLPRCYIYVICPYGEQNAYCKASESCVHTASGRRLMFLTGFGPPSATGWRCLRHHEGTWHVKHKILIFNMQLQTITFSLNFLWSDHVHIYYFANLQHFYNFKVDYRGRNIFSLFDYIIKLVFYTYMCVSVSGFLLSYLFSNRFILVIT